MNKVMVEEKRMPRKVSIGWFRQNSGRYALKGITIHEQDRAYDSTSTFRDEDARWLTKVLGAEADVEFSGNGRGERIPEVTPEWAVHVGQATNVPYSDFVQPLDWERAGAALLRHFLGRMVEACDIENGGAGCQELANEARAALLATDAGTFYTLNEARTMLDRRGQKPGRTKSGL
jgi:hypothetical protein